MKDLIWTIKTPTKIGWYWKRNAGNRKRNLGEEESVVYIRDYVGNLCISNWEIPTHGTQWAGPIPEPKEPK